MRPASCLILLLAGGFVHAATEIYPPFSEDLSFYQSFDTGAEADLSLGKSKNIWKNGNIVFESGVRGLALRCGKDAGSLRFSRPDNLNFDRPGTIVFFYKPLNWEKEKNLPRLFFWGIESSNGYIGLQGANDPKNVCMCARPFHLMILYGKRLPNKVYALNAPGKPGCSGWHMLAFAWAGDKLFLKFDGESLKQFDFPLGLTEKDFPADHFSTGSASHWKYLLDEFMIFSRKLSNEELNHLYKMTIKR